MYFPNTGGLVKLLEVSILNTHHSFAGQIILLNVEISQVIVSFITESVQADPPLGGNN